MVVTVGLTELTPLSNVDPAGVIELDEAFAELHRKDALWPAEIVVGDKVIVQLGKTVEGSAVDPAAPTANKPLTATAEVDEELPVNCACIS